MEFGKAINYTITIEPTANKGFYVSVGCGRLAFSHPRQLVMALDNQQLIRETHHPQDNPSATQLERVSILA